MAIEKHEIKREELIKQAESVKKKEKNQFLENASKKFLEPMELTTGEILALPEEKDFNSLDEIEKFFKNWRITYLRMMKIKAEAEKLKPPKAIAPLIVAELIYDSLSVIKLDKQEGHLAVYNPDNGIYESVNSFFHKLIYWLEPSFSLQKSKEVLFKLETISEVRKQTAEKHLIPVKNGVFNKKTQKLEPFNPKYVFTSTISTAYNAELEAPNIDGWNVDDWLLDLMSGDKELVKLLWQIISASLSGNYSYRKGVWLLGNGNDGKGTFQDLIMNLVGLDNVCSLKAEQFSERFSLATIPGKTVIIGDESQTHYLDNAGNYFSCITGDIVSVEGKQEPMYSAVFKKLIIQSTNFLPTFRNKSNGTYRRLLIVPFKKTFDKQSDNWKIKDIYIKQKDVLEYILKRALALNFDKFDEPQAVSQELEEFQAENDTVLTFVNEWFPQFESEFLPSAFLWWLYEAQMRYYKTKPVGKRIFEVHLPKHLASRWEKTAIRPKGRFRRSADIPLTREYGWYDFPDEAMDKMTRGYLKKKPKQ